MKNWTVAIAHYGMWIDITHYIYHAFLKSAPLFFFRTVEDQKMYENTSTMDFNLLHFAWKKTPIRAICARMRVATLKFSMGTYVWYLFKAVTILNPTIPKLCKSIHWNTCYASSKFPNVHTSYVFIYSFMLCSVKKTPETLINVRTETQNRL